MPGLGHTKAAYRFLDNERVNEADILAGHFHATGDRAAATSGPILVLHDTTEFSYRREDIEAVGKTRINIAGLSRRDTALLYGVRHPDALEPGGNERGSAAWTDGDQVLVAQEVQGRERAKAEDQSDAGAD